MFSFFQQPNFPTASQGSYSGFQQTYRCYSTAMLGRPELEYGGKSKFLIFVFSTYDDADPLDSLHCMQCTRCILFFSWFSSNASLILSKFVKLMFQTYPYTFFLLLVVLPPSALDRMCKYFMPVLLAMISKNVRLPQLNLTSLILFYLSSTTTISHNEGFTGVYYKKNIVVPYFSLLRALLFYPPSISFHHPSCSFLPSPFLSTPFLLLLSSLLSPTLSIFFFSSCFFSLHTFSFFFLSPTLLVLLSLSLISLSLDHFVSLLSTVVC